MKISSSAWCFVVPALLTLATAILAVAKLCGMVSMSWWLILAPLAAPVVAITAVGLAVGLPDAAQAWRCRSGRHDRNAPARNDVYDEGERRLLRHELQKALAAGDQTKAAMIQAKLLEMAKRRP